jgi:hypothetical protein
VVKKHYILLLLIAGPLVAGCAPNIEVFHTPVIANSDESVTFTASVLSAGDGPAKVELYVNATLVQTCPNLSRGDTCAYTGGPYAAYEGTTVSYLAEATDSKGRTDSQGYYFFAITDDSYGWSKTYIPARTKNGSNYDLLFHRASDYASFGDFVDDVEDKMYDVFGEQDIIEQPKNYDDFDFYVYSKVATSASYCGTVHPDTNTDITWREFDAVLHVDNFGDCTSFAKGSFSAEGGNTKAFLHESGHGVFGLADEYNAAPSCYTNYNVPAVDEPNIWDAEAKCRAEQTAKDRDPDACHQFTTCQGGWWGIHQSGDGNVMQVGMVGDPWGIEAGERVRWWFDHVNP